MSESKSTSRASVKAPSAALMLFFRFYLPWYLRRHFHAMRIANAARLPHGEGAFVVYLNHASWWDPLTCMFLARSFFPERSHYAPMDAAALDRYRILARIGMFPVEQGSRRGAVQFLRAGTQVLDTPDSVLWLTPQGAFADVRQRPIAFKAGLASLLKQRPATVAFPLAIEYTYWDERLPEILINVGEPQRFDTSLPAGQIQDQLVAALAATQDALAILAIRRNPIAFKTLLSGGAGVGLAYDLWRRFRALARGEEYRSEHGRASHPAADRADALPATRPAVFDKGGSEHQ